MGTAGGLEDMGLMVSEPPDMERERSLGLSYSSIDMERRRRGIRVTCCIGTADTETVGHTVNTHFMVNLLYGEHSLHGELTSW